MPHTTINQLRNTKADLLGSTAAAPSVAPDHGDPGVDRPREPARKALLPKGRVSQAPHTSTYVHQRQGDRSGGDEPGIERLPVFVRYRDLVAAGIVGSWTQLARLQEEEAFPVGILLSANTRVWEIGEVRQWLATRPSARKVPPPKLRGRPRKPAEAPTQVPVEN